MTDQNIPAVTDDDRRLAREWASNVRRHADKHFPAERAIARVILDAVPTPTPPTLADMNEVERAACRWLQCDYAGETSDATSPGVIGYFDHGGRRAVILTAKCGIVRRDYDRVTPRPDLPRMEWPGDQKPAPAPALPDGWRLADHPSNGRVIVTNTTTRDGRVYYVLPAAAPLGYDWLFCKPDELTYLDQEADPADAAPESTLAVGSVWADADALTRACRESERDHIAVTDRDGDVYVWDANLHDWRDLHPIPSYAPFTIIYAGKKDDQ